MIEKWGVEVQFLGSIRGSYHCPIRINPNKTNWGPKPFKLFNCWFKHPILLFMLKRYVSLPRYKESVCTCSRKNSKYEKKN